MRDRKRDCASSDFILGSNVLGYLGKSRKDGWKRRLEKRKFGLWQQAFSAMIYNEYRENEGGIQT